MNKDDEIRAIIKSLEKDTISNTMIEASAEFFFPAVGKVIPLLKEILNTPEGWPEKIDGYDKGTNTYARGRNDAIDQCNLARLKEKQAEVPTVTEIVEVIEEGAFRNSSWNEAAEAIQKLIKSKQKE